MGLTWLKLSFLTAVLSYILGKRENTHIIEVFQLFLRRCMHFRNLIICKLHQEKKVHLSTFAPKERRTFMDLTAAPV